MFRIAVCDGSKEALKQTCALLYEFAESRKIIDMEVLPFTNTFDLTDALEGKIPFDILITETAMPGLNGIEVSRMLREKKNNIPIIFLTSYKSYALDAFEVSAAQYLIKGKEKESLFATLNQIYDPDHRERRKKILLTAREGIFNIYMRDIMYVESKRNYQLIVLEDGMKLEVRITGKKLAEILEEGYNFKRCSSSYIINWFYLKSMTSDAIIMQNGTTIPIPRGHYTELRRNYEHFHEIINSR